MNTPLARFKRLTGRLTGHIGRLRGDSPDTPRRPSKRRVKTPTVLQMEAVECGAAALGIVLAYFGRIVPLEELRSACGVSRDGSKAVNIVRAARRYGLKPVAYRKNCDGLRDLPLPVIVFWEFNHFLVVEGFDRDRVYLNDPAVGPRTVSFEEFDRSFTGIVITFTPTDEFERVRGKPTLYQLLARRLRGGSAALAFVVLASLALIIPGLAVPAFTQIFVDHVLVGGMGGWVWPLITAMALTALVRAALTALQQHYLLRLETRMALSASSRFLWHVLRLPMEFFAQRFAGDIAGRVAINDRVARLLSGHLATALLDIITTGFYAIVMFYYDATLAAVGVAIALVNIVVLRYVSRARKDAHARLLQENSKLAATAVSGLFAIETLKASGGESDFFARWGGHQAKVVNAEQELGAVSQWVDVVPPLLHALSMAAVLSLGGLGVMDGALTIGGVAAFQTLMAGFLQPIGRFVGLGSQLQQAEGDMNRLEDVLRYPIGAAESGPMTAGDAEADQPDETDMSKLSGRLVLRDITFGYSRLEAPLISNFTLELKPGSRVALVGPTGSGKSTIAKLVGGLYEPWEGDILFDGIPRARIPRHRITHSLGLVDQDISLFEGTIRENLAMWDTSVPEADIIQAAVDACIHEEIATRPEGYDTMVEEGGRNFSGGQRQRLEIARALVLNPTILVLDEATSALDPVTEHRIDDRLRRRGCTCLIVAHRLSTIRDCDEIIVMDQGEVVQRGTHDSMIKGDTPYARLIRSDQVKTDSKDKLDSILGRLY